MKPLQSKVNTQAPDADFPFGDLTDDNGTGNGTPANRELFSDALQFFEKLMFEAGITPNGVLDNEYNGWQLFQALKTIYPLNTKIVQTTWNMDTDPTKAVAHGLSDFTKIRSLQPMIVNNAGSWIIPLVGEEGGISITDATDVTLARVNGGFFDSVAFNAATVYLTIQYVD